MPLVVISVLLHRLRLIGSDEFLSAALLAGLVATAAALAGMIALARLWQSGDRGWGKALLGLLLGLICLAPFAWYGNLALKYPPVTDIATTTRDGLPLVFEPGTASMPPPKMLGKAQAAVVFPNVETRRYPLGQAQTFAIVEQMIAGNDWDVRLVHAPDAMLDPASINAQIVTLPGWREEVVIRVTGDATMSVVDMRSVSLNAPHDFGSNGQRIERFLSDLDGAVTTLLRDNPNINAPEPEPAEAVPVT
ncbi:MAG: DUF1499 domain-containing protein [Devosia sp.]